MNPLRRLVGRIVEHEAVERRKTKQEYEELRNKYLSMGITLEDLFYYFETGPITWEKKNKIKQLIKKHGLTKIYQDFIDWWNLAEEYNPEELSFLHEEP